ncbi:MAG: YkvA family protein [Oculatellaceae cyanobacterium bins.114]|nr:YkvA family protein [Oculatellaceae cyanobacterium bins.114]
MADSSHYSEKGLWEKLKRVATQAGKDVVEKVLMLYYAAQQPETPLWAKTVIYSALAYFILPTDAIPDFTPFIGYADDLGTIAAALVTVTMCITPEVKQAAKQKLQDWFGEDLPATSDHNCPQSSDTIRVIAID